MPDTPLTNPAQAATPAQAPSQGASPAQGASTTQARPAPTPDQITKWAAADKTFWDARNKLLYDLQKMYELRSGAEPAEGQLSVTVNDGRVIVDKLAAMLSNPHRIEVAAPAGRPDLTPVAQKVEDFLIFWRNEINLMNQMGMHGPLEWEEGQSAALRGYIASRLTLDPSSPDFPYRYEVLDIMNLYPRPVGAKIIRVTHQYKARPWEIVEDFPEAASIFTPEELDSETVKDVIAYYDDTYHAVVVGGQFVKEPTPHEYGFNPIQITPCAGAFYNQTPQDDTEYLKMKGQGILARNYQAILDKQDTLSMLKTILGQQADPATTVFTDEDGKAAALEFNMGSRNVLAAKDKVELHRIGAGLQELMAASSLFQDAINKGSFMPAMFGDPVNMSSGFMSYLSIGSARDVATPYVRGMESHYTLLYRRVLQLFARFAPPISFYGIDQTTGQAVSGLTLTPEEVSEVGFHVNVKFRSVSPQDKVQLAQTGSLLARDRVLSLETVRKEWVDVDNPYLENLRVLSELLYMNPQIVQALGLVSAKLFNNPILNEVLATMNTPQGSAPPAAPPGANPEVLPPELGVNAGAPPNTDLLGPQASGNTEFQSGPSALSGMMTRLP